MWLNYLKNVKRFDEENSRIICTNETNMYSWHKLDKTQSDNFNQGLYKPALKGQRLIIVNQT